MKRTIKSIIFITFMLLSFSAVAKPKNANKIPPLKDSAAKHGFKMGGAMSYKDVMDGDWQDMIIPDFNSVTFTNELKLYSLLDWGVREKNGMPNLDFKKADTMLAWCESEGIRVRGHVLVWDAYMTDWFFYKDYRNKNFASREEIEKRMKYCIEQVITHCEERFPGVIYCWDVVNEAVADSPNEAAAGDSCMIRKSRGGAPNYYYDTIGRDYVKLAFKYARDVVEKNGYDIKLFYNDYSTFQPSKQASILKLLNEINAKDEINPEGKKLVDGIGMQGYVGGYGTQAGCMSDRDITLVKNAIEKYAAAGYEVQITEMALRNYNGDAATMKKHAEFCGRFADMIREVSKSTGGKFTCWAIWGLCDIPSLSKDDYGYKMNGPFCGLYDENLAKKDSYYNIAESLSK